MTTSLRGQKSAKKSMPNSAYDFVEEIEGFKVEMKRSELARRSTTILTTEENISKVKKEHIISVTEPLEEDLPAKEEYPAAPLRADDDTDETYTEKMTAWGVAKDKWDEEQAAKPPLKKLCVWAPIYRIVEARVDGMLLKVFHTLRGPMLGLVVSETSSSVTLYSPAYIDPNIQKGMVHFLPVAFAGYQITLHKPCTGESSPDQPVVLGYPKFLKANQAGDFVMRTRGAYHHIEADFAEYAHPVVKDVGMRELLQGILVTSDTRQPQELAKAAAMNKMLKQESKEE